MRRPSPGRVLLVGRSPHAYLDLSDADEALLRWFDGTHSLHDIVRAGLELSPPAGPLRVVGLLKRLQRAGLLEGMTPAQAALVGAAPRPPRPLHSLLSPSALTPALSFLAAPGRWLPPAVWRLFIAISALLLATTWAIATSDGAWGRLVNPIGRPASVAHDLGLFYLGLSFSLSVRSLLQSWVLRSAGGAVPRAGLAATAGVLHLGFDLRERRAATRATRLQMAWVGLASLAMLAAVAGLWTMLNPHSLARHLAPAAFIAWLVDLAPYLRSDGRSVAGILARVPDLRRRALSFLVLRVGGNLASRRPMEAPERRYLALAVATLAHVVAVLVLLVAVWLPAALSQGGRLLAGALSPAAQVALDTVLGVGLALGLALVGLVLLVSLVLLLLRWSWQFLRPTARAASPAAEAPSEAELARFAQRHATRAIFGDLDPTERAALLAAVVRRRYEAGEALAAAGTADPWFGVLDAGRCTVRQREHSGLEHEVASMSAGDFFGLNALAAPGEERDTTVLALEPTTALTLSAADLARVVGDGAGSATRRVRHARALRSLPFAAGVPASAFAALLEATRALEVPAGATIMKRGEHGGSVYLVDAGRVAVEGDGAGAAGRQAAELGPGGYFGEVASVPGADRTATVRAIQPSVLLQVPGDVYRRTLLTSFEAGLLLERSATARPDRPGEV
ncbi:MAG: cyclic nucleotide-binding domain-containing protein [Myxococcota bacterium]